MYPLWLVYVANNNEGAEFSEREKNPASDSVSAFVPVKSNVKNQLEAFLPRCMECRRSLAMRFLSVRLSVCLSVCPSVKRVHCDITEEKSVQIFIPCDR